MICKYELLKANSKTECVIGTRTNKFSVTINGLGSMLYYKWLKFVTHKDIAIGNNFYILRKKCIDKLDLSYVAGSIHARLKYKKYPYKRRERIYGESHYSLGKLISLAIVTPKYYLY